MSFYQAKWTEQRSQELLADLAGLSKKYELSKNDLFEKICGCLGTSFTVTYGSANSGKNSVKAEPATKKEKVKKEKKVDPNATKKGARWTDEEEQTMASAFMAGETCEMIAKKLERTNLGIVSRMGKYVAARTDTTDLATIQSKFGLTSLTGRDLEFFLNHLNRHFAQKSGKGKSEASGSASPAGSNVVTAATITGATISMTPSISLPNSLSGTVPANTKTLECPPGTPALQLPNQLPPGLNMVSAAQTFTPPRT